jgi:hypothetical protein
MFDELTFDWLTICLGAQSSEAKAIQLGGLRDEEWSCVFDLAVQYGVAPLLYDQLKQLCGILAIPKPILERSRGAYLANAARNMRTTYELGLIIRALVRDAVSVVALKGAHLAGNIYPDIALRSIGSDVDLLVSSADLTRACAALRGLGYEPCEGDDLDEEWQAKKNITLMGPPGVTPIELHWTIEHPSDAVRVDLEGLWLRAKPSSVAGCEVLGFAPEDLLLHLCLEGTYHHGNWFRMAFRPLCDIVAIIQHAGERMEWQEVEARARQWRAENLIHLALWLARRWLAAPIPEEVLFSLRPEGFDEDTVAMAKELVFLQSLVPAAGSSMPWKLAQIGGQRPWADKIKIVLGAVFPPRRQIASIYGVPPDSVRSYFYSLLHPISLACRHAPAAWGLVFRKRESAAGTEEINALIQLKERMSSKSLLR